MPSAKKTQSRNAGRKQKCLRFHQSSPKADCGGRDSNPVSPDRKAGVDKETEMTTSTLTLNCNFPEHKDYALTPAGAFVPALAAVAKVVGKPIGQLTEGDLANHAVCKRHAGTARQSGIPFFSFAGSIEEIARRNKERETGQAFFSLYGAMKKAGFGERPAAERKRGRKREAGQ